MPKSTSLTRLVPVVACDEDHVCGLDVPVHDPGFVRHGERREYLCGDPRCAYGVEARLHRQHALDRGALEQLHHEEGRVGRVRPHVDDANDVWMLEPGGRLRFATEPHQVLGLVRQPRVEHLDGHGPLEVLLVGLVDASHAPRADQATDAVTPCE